MAGRGAYGEHGTIEMLSEIKTIVLVALIVILSACQSQPIAYYTPPAGMPLEDSSTLVGSKVRDPSIWRAKIITFVGAIDELPVEGGSKNYDNPIHLSPGKHDVQIGFRQGSGCAKVNFELNIKSRERYIAKGENLRRESIFRQDNIRIWIENSAGDQVTDYVVVPVHWCSGGLGGLIIV